MVKARPFRSSAPEAAPLDASAKRGSSASAVAAGAVNRDGLVSSAAAEHAPSTVMSARARFTVAALVAATLVLILVSVAFELAALRAITVSVFLLVELGAAPALLLKPRSVMSFALATVTTSLVTTVLLGFLMSVLHAWHPLIMFGAVALITVVLLAVAVLRERRRSSH